MSGINAKRPFGGKRGRLTAALRICAIGGLCLVPPASGADSDPSARPDPSARLNPSARPEQIKSGTGFYIAPDNVLLTSAHIVGNCKNIAVFPVDGTERRGLLIALDKDLDLALVSVNGPFPGQTLQDAGVTPRNGEQIYALGYGISATDPYRPIYLTGTFKDENTLPNGVKVLVVHARIPSGTSGAPLVDLQAGLIGVIIGRYTQEPELGVAIPLQSIRIFMKKNGFVMPTPTPRNQTPAARNNTLLRASALVQCNTK